MAQSTIGEQELALLRHIADRGAVSVAEAVERFGSERGLARSTVLTMMERLRKKGHLGRRLLDGIYRYRARTSSADLLKGAVRHFVEGKLNGSVSPFLAYLSEARDVSDAELRELEALVARLNADKTKGTMMLTALFRASLEGAVLVAGIWSLGKLWPRLSPRVLTIAVVVRGGEIPARRRLDRADRAADPAGGAGRAHGTCRDAGWQQRRARRQPAGRRRIAAAAPAAGARARLAAVAARGVARRASRWRMAVSARRWRITSALIGAPDRAARDRHWSALDVARALGLRRAPPVRVSKRRGHSARGGILEPVIVLPSERFAESVGRRAAHGALSRARPREACRSLARVRAGAGRAHLFLPPAGQAGGPGIRLCREAACDAAVIDTLETSPQEYGRLLLALGVTPRRTAAAAAGAPWSLSTLKRRITMLREPSSPFAGARAPSPRPRRRRHPRHRPTAPERAPAAGRGAGRAAPAEPRGIRPRRRTQREGLTQLRPVRRRRPTTQSGDRAGRPDREADTAATASGCCGSATAAANTSFGIRAAIDQVIAIWAPVNELGEDDGKARRTPGRVGARQGEIGERQGRIGQEQGVLGAKQGALGARQGRPRGAPDDRLEHRRRKARDRRRVSQNRRRIRALDVRWAELDARMRELEKPMGDLDVQMEGLNREMNALSDQMNEALNRAKSEMAALIDQSMASGVAVPVK